MGRLVLLFRAAAKECAQLLFGPSDNGRRFGDDLAAKFELAEEIELLARESSANQSRLSTAIAAASE